MPAPHLPGATADNLSFPPKMNRYYRGQSVTFGRNTPCLLYPISGICSVEIDEEVWIVTPRYAVWLTGETHTVRMLTDVELSAMSPLAETAVGNRVGNILKVRDLLRALILEATRIDARTNLTTRESLVARLLFEELARAERYVCFHSRPSDKRLIEIWRRTMRDPFRRHSLGDFAIVTGLSVATLSRLFLREMGLSYGKWIKAVRQLALDEAAS